MDIQAEKERCQQAKKRIDELTLVIRESRQAVADHECPFKVGDKVISGSGQNEIIASISFNSWSDHYGLRYSFKTFKLKKNGDQYVNSSSAWNIEKYMPTE